MFLMAYIQSNIGIIFPFANGYKQLQTNLNALQPINDKSPAHLCLVGQPLF